LVEVETGAYFTFYRGN